MQNNSKTKSLKVLAKQGTLKERLQGLGNAVVPVIPEYLGGEIINNE